MVPVTTSRAAAQPPTAGRSSTGLRAVALPACILLAAVSAALLLLRSPPPAGWVTLVGKDAATAGAPWTATVTLQPPFQGSWLGVDLHGADAGDRWLGCVGSAAAQRIDPATPTFQFTVPVAADPAISKVWAVIVLSTAADWDSRTMMAASATIPVRQGAAAAAARSLAVHAMVYEPPTEDAASLRVRAVVAAVWLAAAVLYWRRRGDGSRWPLLLGSACVGIAAFELSGAGPRVLDTVRELVQQHHLYEQRRLLQALASVAVLLGSAAFTALGLRRARAVPALAIAGIGLYAAVALLGMLSLHEADHLLTARVLSLPVGKVLRLGAGLLALAAALGRREGRAPAAG
jgi:hypothetical protein